MASAEECDRATSRGDRMFETSQVRDEGVKGTKENTEHY